MFEIFIFLKKISQTSFWVLPYFSKYHISQVSRVLLMRNIPSWPSGRALFNREVWMTPLVKCLSYVENKNVREKKIKKITHIEKKFFFFRNARVFGQLIWKFQPDLTVSIFNFFSPSNNSTNWGYLRLTAQSYWPPDKLKHDAWETDILAIETAEISRRQKKNETIVGEIYMSQSQNYDFFCFCSGFRVSKVLSFSLLQFIGMPNLHNLSKSEWPNLPHIYAMRLGTGGARRPPGPPFDELAQICWYFWIESQVPRFIIRKSFSEFLRDEKVFWKKR